MRAFIILGFLAAAVSASNLGYNYGPGLVSSGYGLGSIGSLGGGGIISATSAPALIGGSYNSYGSGLLSSGGLSSGLLSSGSSLLNSGSSLINSGGLISSGSSLINNAGGSRLSSANPIVLSIDAVNSVPQQVEISKQFFDFSAPEEEQDTGVINQQVSNVLKKNLQVVFIKAPENNAATNAALQVAKQAIEQKTAIYLLSKENDANQVIGTLQQIQENVPTTPEVRIIKYKTQGDLINARNTIQSQYENIGGSSQVVDGGIAPVLNYASKSVSVSGPLLGGSNYITSGSNIGSGLVSSLGSGLGSNYISSGSNIGSGLVSSLGSGLGSGLVSNIGSGLGSGLGVNYVSSTGSVPLVGTTSISGASSGSYLPPSPLKK